MLETEHVVLWGWRPTMCWQAGHLLCVVNLKTYCVLAAEHLFALGLVTYCVLVSRHQLCLRNCRPTVCL